MADETVSEDIEVPAPKRGGMSGKKLVLFIALPLLLLVGGGAGAYFAGLLDPLLGNAHGEEEVIAAQEEDHGPSVYYDLPEMLVNLDSGARRPSYLKLRVSLELRDPHAIETIEGVLPRIVDTFQVYLRGLRVDDLSGSAGMQRLREELRIRVSKAAEDVEVKDVLFNEMLVQ